MFDKDLLSLLTSGKITLEDAQEIRSRREKRRERYDESASAEAISMKNAPQTFRRKYKKPALKKANILKTSQTTEINPNFSLDLSSLQMILEQKVPEKRGI